MVHCRGLTRAYDYCQNPQPTNLPISKTLFAEALLRHHHPANEPSLAYCLSPRIKMKSVETQVRVPDGTTYMQPTGLLIDNEFVPAVNGGTLPATNPYTQESICHIASGKHVDVDLAVAAADRAFPGWKATTPGDRSRLIHRLADLIERDADTLARIEATNGGKPVKLARTADVLACASCLRYYAGWADKVTGSTVDTGPESLNMVLREPLGVCALIVPWNFPLLLCGWKLGPSLCVGNTVVVKPAELTSLSALYLGKLVVEAGFPPGVVNIVSGLGSEAGAALVTHPKVSKISFTGSSAVGKGILKTSADTNLKKVTLELGGKSPSIVLPSADLDNVVEWVNGGIFYNMGSVSFAQVVPARFHETQILTKEPIDKIVARAAGYMSTNPCMKSSYKSSRHERKEIDLGRNLTRTLL